MYMCVILNPLNRSDDTFPRSLSALRSPHLGKWLDSVAVDLPRSLETDSKQISSVAVAIAVADFFLREKSYHRVQLTHTQSHLHSQPHTNTPRSSVRSHTLQDLTHGVEVTHTTHTYQNLYRLGKSGYRAIQSHSYGAATMVDLPS